MDCFHGLYGRQTKYLKVIQWLKMNLPHKPCEDSPSYSLTRCLRESVSKKVGCRPVWDRWSDKKRKICTEMEELTQFEREFFELSSLEKKHIKRRQVVCFPVCTQSTKLWMSPSSCPRIVLYWTFTWLQPLYWSKLKYLFTHFHH